MTEPQVDAFGRPVKDNQERPAPPQALVVARWLWIASVLVGVVQAFVELFDRARLIDQLRTVQPELDQMQLDELANSTITFTFTIKLLTLLVYLMLARRMLEGTNWARVVLTVFGGWGIFSAVLTVALLAVVGTGPLQELMPVSLTWTDALFGGLAAAVSVAAIVFMFRPEANRFIREARQRRVRSGG